ncbi:MAG: hypothetical protein CMJ32_08135 [Phycisphaerae bacterium]|nr:hypothetical protein [Phycisphaerae bacterium]
MTNDPKIPDVQMHLATPAEPVTGTIVLSELCTKGKSSSFVRHVSIDLSGTPLEGNFWAGQSFGIIPPGEDEKGRPHKVRLYSVASPRWGEDGQGKVISTTPKRLIDEYSPADEEEDDRHELFLGVCSNYLCDLKPGDKVKVTGPSGKRFLLPTDHEAHDYLFLATGTGIAPFRGMCMELFEGKNGPCKSQVHLVMGAPYSTDLLYDDLFERLEKDHPNFHYHRVISRETGPVNAKGRYVHHYLDNQIQQHRDFLANPRTLMYICGLAGMQVGIFQMLGANQLGENYFTVHEELEGIDPKDWTDQQIKRRVRPTRRCMLEVY